MTEPSPPRPVPGPPRTGPVPAPEARPAGSAADGSTPASGTPATAAERSDAPSFADLAQRPVAKHVSVFEAEHARLQRELGTIDQL